MLPDRNSTGTVAIRVECPQGNRQGAGRGATRMYPPERTEGHLRRDVRESIGASRRGRLGCAALKASLALLAIAAYAGMTGSAAAAACPNEELRVGPSAHLPD